MYLNPIETDLQFIVERYIMVYFVSLYLFMGVILTTTLLVFSLTKGKGKHSLDMGLLCIATGFYVFGYLMELNVSTFEQMKFWNLVQFFGMPLVPAFWLHISYGFFEKEKVGSYKLVISRIIIFAIPMSTLFIRLTNDMHRLYYKDMYLKDIGMTVVLYLEKGIWFYVQTLYIILTLIISNILFYLQYKKSSEDNREKFRLLIIATLTPVFALMMIIANVGELGIDYTAMILPISVLLIFLALTKYDFLEIKFLAREKIFEESTTGMLLLNSRFRIMDYNRVIEAFFLGKSIELKTENINHVLTDEPELLKAILSKNTVKWTELVKGEIRYYEITLKILKNEKAIYGYLVNFEDITKRELLQQKLTLLASTDPLSGLNNYRSFLSKSEQAIAKAKEKGSLLTVMMLDLDYFKTVNDNYGHICGDYVLREFAQLMRANFRENDILGRVGGEEFAVILSNTAIEEAYAYAENFRKKVAKTRIDYQGEWIDITVSIGLAELESDDTDLSMILDRADKCLYQSKKNGRDQCYYKGVYEIAEIISVNHF